MQRKLIIIFILFLSAVQTFARSRYFNDANEEFKRPKLLVFPFINKDPQNKNEEYTKRLPDNIISKFSSDIVQAFTKPELNGVDVAGLQNDATLARLKFAANAYSADFIMVGEYRFLTDIHTETEKIQLKIGVYDTKLGLLLFTLEFTGYPGLGYYALIDAVTSQIQLRLDKYKKDMDNIARQITRTNTSPLNINNVLTIARETHPMDPAYVAPKGTFLIVDIPDYTRLEMQFSNGKMVTQLFSNFIWISYGITDWLEAGISVGFTYYNKRTQESSPEYNKKNRLYNPNLFFKLKIANQESHGVNFAFTLDIQPNFSDKTYSSDVLIMRFPTIIGMWKTGLAFSKVFNRTTLSLRLQTWIIHFNDSYYDDETYPIDIRANKTISGVFFLELGGQFQLSTVFIIDLRFSLLYQSKVTLDIHDPGWMLPGEYKSETITVNTSTGVSLGLFFHPDNNTYIGLTFYIRPPFMFYYQSSSGGGSSTEVKLTLRMFFTFILRFNTL